MFIPSVEICSREREYFQVIAGTCIPTRISPSTPDAVARVRSECRALGSTLSFQSNSSFLISAFCKACNRGHAKNSCARKQPFGVQEILSQGFRAFLEHATYSESPRHAEVRG